MNKEVRRITESGGFISFTFDDFPESASETGASILEKYGMRGVFFFSGSLEGQNTPSGKISSISKVQELESKGHEIGSHSFSHHRPFTQTESSFDSDLNENTLYLDNHLKQKVRSFSYPYGECKPSFKATCREMFEFSRGILPGINPREFDAAYLRANKLYDSLYSEDYYRKLIDQTIEKGGWLILYSHDVTENCSPFGCRPGQLENVVKYAAASGITPATFGDMKTHSHPF